MSKISLTEIIKDHFKTLIDINTNRAGFDDYFSFLILPILISSLMTFCGLNVNNNSIETIVGSLSIFVGLLFNALVILLDIARKQESAEIKQIIVKEVTANISFAIIVSFIAIFIMLFGFIEGLSNYIKIGINLLSFFLLSEFALVFLMVLKRIYLIFKKELKDSSTKTN